MIVPPILKPLPVFLGEAVLRRLGKNFSLKILRIVLTAILVFVLSWAMSMP